MKNLFRTSLLLIVIALVWFYARRTKVADNPTEKTLVTLAEAHIKSFDPIHEEGVYTTIEVAKVYEGLFEYHYLKDPCELVPNLAAEMPSISEDGCVYTIKLRKDARFHDNPCFENGKGRLMVADDFVYSLKRVVDPHSQSGYAGILGNKIKGLNKWVEQQKKRSVADYEEKLDGIKALDKHTVQITLNKPWPQLAYIFTMSFSYVVPREAVEYYGKEFLNNPVGTGPFVLEKFSPQLNKLVYRKNPTYRDKYFPSEASDKYQHLLGDAGKKLPMIDKIITHILPEEQPRWLKFKLKKADIIDLAKSNVALEVVKDNILAPELAKQSIQLIQEPTQSVSYFVFNLQHELFKNAPQLRQAIALAFDLDKYNEIFFKNSAIPAQSIVPPGLQGYREDYVNPYSVYDIEKAKQLLVKAGYPGGKGIPPITLDVTANTLSRQKGEFFQKCLAQIGIKVKIVPNIFPEQIRKIHHKQTMMHTIGWASDYPDAENFLHLLYKDAQRIGGMGANFDDEAFNTLYEKATTMPISPARTMLYEQLNRMAAEKLPAIYTVHPKHIVLHHGWVKNYRWSDAHYGNEQYVDIDLEEKKSLQ